MSVTSAKRLYAIDGEFRGLIQTWVTERQCPLGMVDKLLECGLEKQSRAALWAATKEKRPVSEDGRDFSHPYPNYASLGNYIWAGFGWRDRFARDYPLPAGHPHFHLYRLDEGDVPVHEAMLWLLDNWRVE